VVDQQAYNTELYQTARMVLSSIRRSLENVYPPQSISGPDGRYIEELKFALEAALTSFETADHGTAAAYSELAFPLREISSNKRSSAILRVPFHLIPQANHEETSALTRRFFGPLFVGQALRMLEDLLLASARSREPSTLRPIVPDQKSAPVQFDISNNRIIVSHRKSPRREVDNLNIEAARAELLKNSDKIISELLQSNCDRRLLASVQELQAQFQGEIDAIKIGLMNLGCEMMCNSYEAELPTAVASMLRAHTRGVQMFVGQFPEWARFVENAAAADLDQADITNLRAASQTLVEEMNAKPELVDPEVPRTIAYLAEMLNSPAKAGKRAAFAMLRSLENLVSRVFGYGADFLEKTAEKSVDGASTAASKVIVGMLLLGLTGAVAIGPVSSKIPDMNWMKTATEIVKKQLDELTGK
jgi:hypothetical protein